MTVHKVALLTAGGIAPCLSSAVGGLIERYTEVAPEVEIIAYRDGYAGLLFGRSVPVGAESRSTAHRLHRFGGRPIGKRTIKLSVSDEPVTCELVRPYTQHLTVDWLPI